MTFFNYTDRTSVHLNYTCYVQIVHANGMVKASFARIVGASHDHERSWTYRRKRNNTHTVKEVKKRALFISSMTDARELQ